MDAPEVWVAKDDGTEFIRASDIAAVSLDYNGNVTARLVGGDAALVTLVAHRSQHDEHRPEQFHRQLIRILAELSDSSGSHLVRPVHDEPGGWHWVTEQL
jgi:hypothetical protein